MASSDSSVSLARITSVVAGGALVAAAPVVLGTVTAMVTDHFREVVVAAQVHQEMVAAFQITDIETFQLMELLVKDFLEDQVYVLISKATIYTQLVAVAEQIIIPLPTYRVVVIL